MNLCGRHEERRDDEKFARDSLIQTQRFDPFSHIVRCVKNASGILMSFWHRDQLAVLPEKDVLLRQVFGYCRVSTEQQASEGISLDAQQGKISAWCALNGYSLAGIFVDAGISGKRADNRPELQKALGAVTECGGVLLVYSLSRLARSTKDTLSISERLEKAGADLVSLSEKIDTTSAAGKMVFRMLAVLAEFERDLVSERTIAALQHKRKRGGRMGLVPFGFRVDADGDSLVVSPDEQRVISMVHQLRGEGQTLQKIAERLIEMKIPNKAGRIRWNTTQVHRLLLRNAFRSEDETSEAMKS